MKERIASVPPRLRARIAGALYFVIIVVALFAASVVRGATFNEFGQKTNSGQKEEKTMQASVNAKATGRFLRTLLICCLAPAAVGLAQNPPPTAAPTPQPNPLSAHSRMMYRGVKGILVRSAELMPEDNYGFKPTESVRSFGQIIGHVADSQYTFCSRVLGETRPALKIEETKTSKADLIAALKAAGAYCDKAYDGMTDATAVERVKLMGSDAPKLGALAVNNTHSIEHYGNLIVYLRMKNIVPPTSDQAFMQEMMKK